MNKKKVTELLLEGYSVKQVADEIGMEAKNLYHFAKKNNLPYNAPIKSGGPKEKRILRLVNSGFSPKDIGAIFKLSPKIVENIVEKSNKK